MAPRFYAYDTRERHLETPGVNDAYWVRHQSLVPQITIEGTPRGCFA